MLVLPHANDFSLMLWPRPRLPAHALGEIIDLGQAALRVFDNHRGSGQGAYVVVPDPPNVIEHCLPLIQRLSAKQRVIAFELPGFGYSRPRRGFRFDTANQSALINILFERLNLSETVLDMSCLGAYIALDFAVRYPARVRHLLIQQAPSLADAQRWARGADFHGVIRTPWLGQCFMCLLRRRVTRHCYGSALPPQHSFTLQTAYESLALDALAHGGQFLLADAYQSLLAQETEAAIPSQPVTIIWGAADGSHICTPPRSLLKGLPAARFFEFDDCGHFPGLEAPARYDSVLRDTLSVHI
ncbi:alpha/beta hydrolase [Pseudomonas sp.]|uniref:alpha/beta fold hydrolase n=1 Tax=Pseudomonas sp. TaxID=306 RepID=UPI0023576A30|nr:alpha/beta hydrolase [Pseudomonas sp.]